MGSAMVSACCARTVVMDKKFLGTKLPPDGLCVDASEMIEALMRGDLPLARLHAQLLAIDASSQGWHAIADVARDVLHHLGQPTGRALPGLGAALENLAGLLNPDGG
jgi:hypothetical protein